jgi:hypothetical protein
VLEALSQLATDDWQDVVAERLEKILGRDLWDGFQLRGLRSAVCEALAAAAQELLKASTFLPDAAGELAANVVAKRGGAQLECEVARQVAKFVMNKITLPVQAKLKATARGLQTVGIYICATLGQIDSCPCLRDLVKEVGAEAIKQTIRNAL